MKRASLVLCLALSTAILPACSSGVPQSEHDALQAELSSAQSDYSSAQNELEATKNELSAKLNELAQEKSSKETLNQEVAQLESGMAELDTQLNHVLDTELPQYYSFTYLRRYDWTLPISLRNYFYFKDQPRINGTSKYKIMATDPSNDEVIDTIVQMVKQTILTYNLKSTDVIDLVAAFTKALPHTDSEATTPYDEYTRYPIETLFEQGGDCEDTSILAAAILTRLEYKVAFFLLESKKHVALGIDIPAATGSSWEYQAVRYYYLETAGQSSRLGEIPSGLHIQPVILPIE